MRYPELLAAFILSTALFSHADDRNTNLSEEDANRNLVAKLQTLEFDLDYEDARVADILVFLSDCAKIRMVIDIHTVEAMGEQSGAIKFHCQGTQLSSVLDQLLNPKKLRYSCKSGVLWIEPGKE